MNNSRKEYRWIRLITGAVLPLTLSLAVVIVTASMNEGWEPAGRLSGVCKELVRGTTEGRQALAGSCWNGPLATLFYLPVAWMLPPVAAGYAAFFLAYALMLWSVREALKSSAHAFTHIIAAQAGITIISLSIIPASVLTIGTVLPVAFFAIAFGSLLDWSARMRLRDVVMTGAGVGMLAVSGIHFFTLAIWLALAIPFIWFWHRPGERFARTTSTALVGWLPWIYTFGTWILLNWLIMGEPLFFLSSLAHSLRGTESSMLAVLGVPSIIIIGYLVMGIIFARNSVDEVASPLGNRLFSLLIVIAAAVYLYGLIICGFHWCASEMLLSMMLLLLIFFVRFFNNRALIVISTALSVAVAIGFAGTVVRLTAPKVLSADERKTLRHEIEQFVAGQTAYGRVFIPGYTGLSLLQDYNGELLAPTLHFHVNTLRRDYFGQDLYVLVPKPEGFTAMEYVFAAYPGIYKYGCERLLYARKFDDWVLFQVVSAPILREQK